MTACNIINADLYPFRKSSLFIISAQCTDFTDDFIDFAYGPYMQSLVKCLC